MITLSKSGSTVTFTFDENSGYLQNGTIEVPVNSLSLVIDDSDMATFKKSASNDIFISARYEEFGKTKAELESWYKENMVGSTGGGVDSGTVQTMIDTSTANYFDNAEYDSGTTRINFYHGNTVKVSLDASAFVIDGMIDDVRIETISGTSYLVIDFNTASGKEDIQIPLTDIFDPSNYYTKTEVDASLSGKADTTAVTEAISAATDDMATKTWVGEQGYLTEHQSLSAYSTTEEVNSAITEATSGKLDTSTFETYSGSVETALSGKQDTLSAGRAISISSNTVVLDLPISAGTGTNSIAEGYNTTASGQYSHAECNNTVASGFYSHAEGLMTSATSMASHAEGVATITKNFNEHASGIYNVSNTGSTTADMTLFSVGNGEDESTRHNAFEIRQNGDIYISSGNTDIKLQDNLGGNNVVELTQAQYDALVTAGTVDLTAFYVITDATPINMANYYTTAQTDTAISQAVSGKQDTLVSGTNIKTINNESLLGSGNIDIQGGGKAVTGGTNISITTGETADTISCTLPLTVGGDGTSLSIGSNNFGLYTPRSLAIGDTNSISNTSSNSLVGGKNSSIGYASPYSIAFGYNVNASGTCSCSFGSNTKTLNGVESTFGKYNVSNTGSTNADNTLFSVGNGTSTSARHNAFEIRQNGDIYLTLNGQDVKLQDQLGGGEVSSAITSGDTNAVAGGAVYDKFDEVEQVTAAGLNAVNDKFGGLKLQQITQSAYDALVTKDASTLYVIVN